MNTAKIGLTSAAGSAGKHLQIRLFAASFLHRCFPVPILYVSCDGTGTPMRREELRGVKGKGEDGTARTREAKLGCVFTQSVRDADGAPLRDPDSTSYVATYKGCREIAVMFHQEARRRGLDRAGQVIFIGDGAAWVCENCRLTFPGAVEILDF